MVGGRGLRGVLKQGGVSLPLAFIQAEGLGRSNTHDSYRSGPEFGASIAETVQSPFLKPGPRAATQADPISHEEILTAVPPQQWRSVHQGIIHPGAQFEDADDDHRSPHTPREK